MTLLNKGTELRDFHILLGSFNRLKSKEVLKELNDYCKGKIFSPVKHYELQELKALEKTEQEFDEARKIELETELAEVNLNGTFSNFMEEFKAKVGDFGLLAGKVYKLRKTNNGFFKTEWRTSSFPYTLNDWIQDINKTQVPDSIVQVIVDKQKALIGDEEIYTVKFTSVIYDNLSCELVKHFWEVICTKLDNAEAEVIVEEVDQLF